MIPELGKSPREGLGYPLQYSWASLVAQLVKNLPTMWETWVQSLGWEDPLEKGKATRSSILAWRIPSDYSLWGHKESDTTEQLKKKKKDCAEIKIRSTHLSKERKPCIPFHISLYSFNLSALT